MKIIHEADAPKHGASAHRPGGVAFTYLLEGEENTPENFSLMLVHVENEYHAPRHRHNFDQVRIMLDGSFGFDRGQTQGPQSVGYFTEGLYYTQRGTGPSTTLLLQIGGASGSGYMSNRQLRASVAALEQCGTFHDGVYTRTDGQNRHQHQDGYEAAWEHTFGRSIAYPTPRYDTPIVIAPGAFAWVNDTAQRGVAHKRLGSFHERGLGLSYCKLDADASAQVSPVQKTSAWVVLSGHAGLDSAGETLVERSALQLSAGEYTTLHAGSAGAMLVRFDFPSFD
jgi:quercetin dioxygenase-like cupin family protein